ncbi:MAG: hypothetical protein NE327_16180 [Lentisphaeraceae bacterium]|nr:hypothetical protein [Lentisphaeraceae bacterium]
MSDEFENMLKDLPLKEPSNELDNKISSIISSEGRSAEPISFNFKKFLTYAVAASLFLAIGVTEMLRKDSQPAGAVADQNTPAENISKPVKADSAIKVSTSESSDNFLRGEVIELDNGSFVRPVIRQKTTRKIYYDSETNTQIVVEDPENEIYYVPLEVD